jgi:hypothetical protein
MDLEFHAQVNPGLLHDELAEAGVRAAVSVTGAEVIVHLANATQAPVAREVVARHDPPRAFPAQNYDCQQCGACCRRGVLRIMPAREGRCVQLAGIPGYQVSCRLYADRPEQCRAFQAGGLECQRLRRQIGLSLEGEHAKRR